ncbi:MAG TPA: DUF1003 domain-containing protein [Gemmataceae bacterium]|nr:DUF1003 domain-containing protein [Gemmataceae bacterium]
MRWFRRYRPHVPPTVKKNIDSVKELEEELARQRSRLDRLSDAITRFTGSVRFVIAHLVFFAVWMAVNAAWFLGAAAFDPYPFVFLNLVLAMETVILSTFVLMSQNRQQRQAEQWAHIDLQVSLLAEQEATKMLQMLRAICQRLDLKELAQDRELKEMMEKTQLDVLAEEVEKAHKEAAAETGA